MNFDIEIKEGKNYMCDKYLEHSVFVLLNDIAEFYNFLSFSTYRFPKLIKASFNIDSNIQSSIGGTIESIYCLLKIGRINDAYSLVRKYNDAIIVDIYKFLLMNKDQQSLEKSLTDGSSYDPFDTKVNDWASKIVDIKANIHKIHNDSRLSEINHFFDFSEDSSYIKNRQLCNDNSHYNSLRFFVLNDNDLYLGSPNIRLKYVDKLKTIIMNLLVIHFSYICVLHPEYLTSTDYIDNLDCGSEPAEGSQYEVAPFVQNIFDKYVSPNNNKLADYLSSRNYLELIYSPPKL